MPATLSIMMPVLNERRMLAETLRMLFAENASDIFEVVLVLHPTRTLPESRAAVEKAVQDYPGIVRAVGQELPFVGGALRKGFAECRAEFTVMMACDGETDPHLVKAMLALQHETKADMVTATRWKKGGGFEGYGLVKLVLNYIVQKALAFIYGTKLSDLSYAYRLVRTSILHSIKWEGINHEIFLETLLKPLLLKCKIVEIPVRWKARTEGVSQIRAVYFLKYLWLALKLRVVPVREWIKTSK